MTFPERLASSPWAAVVSYGAFTIVQFVSWLIVLISGRMPDSLYQALAAALRYQTRVTGFAFMLTSAYPSGLYGDPGTAGTAGTAGPQPGYEAFGAQPGYEGQPGQPGYGTPGSQPGYGDPQGWATQAPGDPQGWATQQPGYGQQPGYEQPGYKQPGYEQPGYGQQPYGQQPEYGTPQVATGLASWWLVLSRRAKALVTMFIVLGVLFAAGEAVIEATVTSNVVSSAEANNQLQSALNPLNSALSKYSSSVQSCQTNACVSSLNRMVAGAFDTFAAQVRDIQMPSGQTSAEAANLASAASHVASIYSALAAATTQSQYQSIASGLQPAVNQVQQAYTTLTNKLAGS